MLKCSEHESDYGQNNKIKMIKMIIHYANKLINCQLAPRNIIIIDRQSDAPITVSLAQFSIDTSIHLRVLIASASCVKNCKRTSPLPRLRRR